MCNKSLRQHNDVVKVSRKIKKLFNNNANRIYFDDWYAHTIDSLFSNVRTDVIFFQ